jgi:hypothetical protein
MQSTPISKKGCAKKQTIDTSFLLEDNRRCIKVYNEEDVLSKKLTQAKNGTNTRYPEEPKPSIKKYNEEDIPVKRQKTKVSETVKVQTVLPSDMEKFYLYMDKLESLFNEKEKKDEKVVNPEVEPQQKDLENGNDVPEAPENTEGVSEVLKKLVQELDKATKLTPSQVKVVESYGIPYEVNPWKYEPRIVPRSDKNFEYGRRDFRRHKNRPPPKVMKRFQDLNFEEMMAEIPEDLKPKFFDTRYSLKLVDVGFSLKKTIINEHNLRVNLSN